MRDHLRSISMAFLVLLAVSEPCLAYINYGVGTESCGQWVTSRQSGNWHSMGQWMLGFISATGYYRASELKKGDSLAFAVYMDNYCNKNPLEQFDTGVKKLVEDLSVEQKP